MLLSTLILFRRLFCSEVNFFYYFCLKDFFGSLFRVRDGPGLVELGGWILVSFRVWMFPYSFDEPLNFITNLKLSNLYPRIMYQNYAIIMRSLKDPQNISQNTKFNIKTLSRTFSLLYHHKMNPIFIYLNIILKYWITYKNK